MKKMSYNDPAFYVAETFIENCPDALLKPTMGSLSGRNAPRYGSSAILMKLACLVRNDRMRDEIANQSDLRFGVLLCFHLHFSLFPQD
jgi:hypothetical protein